MPLRLHRAVWGLAWAVATLLNAQPTQPAASGADQSIAAIQQAIEDGQPDQARERIAASLRKYPANGGILNLRGVLHAQQRDMAAARADFQEAIRLSPGLLPAWQNLARACQTLAGESAAGRDTGAMDCALRSWRHVLGSLRGDAEALSALATLHEWRGDFSESLRQIEALAPADGAELPMLALRCADLAGLGRVGEAIEAAKHLSRSPGYTDEIAASVFPVLRTPETAPVLIVLAEALDSAHQASPETLRLLGLAYEKTGRSADARKTIERAAVMEPGETADLYELARLAYLGHDREGALGYLGHIRDIAPKDARAHFLFGIIAVEMELPLEARNSLTRALELDPKNPIYSLALGSLILSGRDAGDAAPYFQTYLTAHPEDPRGHFALGMAYFAASEYPQARAEMTRVAARPETSGGAEYFLGRIARAEDSLDEAALHLERAIQLLPKFPDARAELAKVRLRQGLPDKARAAIDSALAIDPDNYQANLALLALLEKAHDPKAAAQRDHLKQLESKRKAQEQLMLRTIEMRPF